MKFSVPTNFKPDFLKGLPKEHIASLYGKLHQDSIGGGRPSFLLPPVSRSALKKHVADIHRSGLKFNYLLNAARLDDGAFSKSGIHRVKGLLDWLAEIRVDSVTVAVPHLAGFVKKHYPQFGLYASSFANIDSLPKASFWQDLGADLIVLEPTTLNRDFETLDSIRRGVRCKLELVANNACLLMCPFNRCHQEINARASRGISFLWSKAANLCSLNCKYLRLKDPLNFICSDWIRPEDVGHYEDIGIDSLKIAGRARGKDFILSALSAYINRSYKGNLADLFPFFYGRNTVFAPLEKKELRIRLLRYIRFIFGKGLVKNLNIASSLSDFEVYIDNSKLEGFLDFFIEGRCGKKTDKKPCVYCQEVAKSAVSFPKGFPKDGLLARYRELMNG